MTTTLIRKANWSAVWDASLKTHRYARDSDIVFSDDRIVYVGPDYDGQWDHEIDGRSSFVMPGLINIHSHPQHEPAYRGIREEHGRPEMYDTGLYERLQAFSLDDEGRQAAAELAYGELLLCGVTTLADLSSMSPWWLDLIARSGLRGFIAPGFASSRWYMDSFHELKFNWNEQAGRKAFDEAAEFMTQAEAHPSKRLQGVVYPMQIDTCSEDLLRDCIALAEETNRPITTHASQSQVEFLLMAKRHGVSPIKWASNIGLLGPRTTLGHAIFIDDHPSIDWRTREDLNLLVDSGTSVAHCPSPFARYGHAMADFGRYYRAGVNLGFGTDVTPHNLIEEMRLAIILARVMANNIKTTDAQMVFHAATVGGAKSLLRDDLGRLEKGAKADLVMVDITQTIMRPVHDPLKSLIYHAADRAVKTVFIDGELAVDNGSVVHLDMSDAAGRLEIAQQRMLKDVPNHDFLGREAKDITPLSLML